MKKIVDVFAVNSGVVFKRKEAPPNISGYKYKLITLKSINDAGYIDSDHFDDFVSIKEITDKHIAKVGDIVIRLSSPFTAAVIDKNSKGAVITSLFAVLRPKVNNIFSEYVAIYLNSDYMKRQYHKDASGSALQMIKTSALKGYMIMLPSAQRQKKIININRLSIKESLLIEELLENKKLLYKNVINKLIIEELV